MAAGAGRSPTIVDKHFFSWLVVDAKMAVAFAKSTPDLDVNFAYSVEDSEHEVTPLQKVACTDGDDVTTIRFLLERRADPNLTTHATMSPLWYALNNDNWKCASALMRAGAHQQDVVRSMLDMHPRIFIKFVTLDGVNVNGVLDAGQGNTMLMEAVRRSFPEHDSCVAAIIRRGANVDARDTRGQTALMIAASYFVRCRGVFIRELLSANASLSLVDNDGLNAACHAIIGRAPPAILEQLIPPGSVNTPYGGRSMLLIAAQFGTDDAIRYLLGHGADVRAVDAHGNTVLHTFAHSYGGGAGELDLVAMMVENGADMDQVNNAGDNALDIAIKTSDSEPLLIEFLQSRGAVIHNIDGVTAYLATMARDSMEFMVSINAGHKRATNILRAVLNANHRTHPGLATAIMDAIIPHWTINIMNHHNSRMRDHLHRLFTDLLVFGAVPNMANAHPDNGIVRQWHAGRHPLQLASGEVDAELPRHLGVQLPEISRLVRQFLYTRPR